MMIQKVKNKIFNRSTTKEIRVIPIHKILRGSEGDHLTGLQYVNMTGDKHRTSTRVIDGPQVKLLQEYERIGEAILEKSLFEKTEYYQNAFQSICYVQDYFPAAKRPEDIIKIATRFIYSYAGKPLTNFSNEGHNQFKDPITVRPIYNSDCYQLIGGNHRIASNYMIGKKELSAIITPNYTHTYFTDLIGNVVWDNAKELYQPIDLPEYEHLPLIRKCSDRLEKILTFLISRNFKLENSSLIDIGSYYGWFIDKFRKEGALVYGLEKDFSACKVASELFDLTDNQLINQPLESFLINNSNTYDIVLFLSVLHHFSMKKSFMSDQQVFRELSKRTNKVMFFDTGEEHEKMFGDALKGWNVESITKFIKENSDFREVIPLGRDSDNTGKYSNDYSRMLFALVK